MNVELFTSLVHSFETNKEMRLARKVIGSSDSVVMIGRRNDNISKFLGMVGFDGIESDLYFSSLSRNISFFESIVVLGVDRESFVQGIVEVKNRGKICELTEGVL